jgi:hypothetical protein
MDLTFTEFQFEPVSKQPGEHCSSPRVAECVAHAQRCRQLGETARSHSVRQMLIEQANGREAMMFNFGTPTE